jgi:hypothetical protein
MGTPHSESRPTIWNDLVSKFANRGVVKLLNQSPGLIAKITDSFLDIIGRYPIGIKCYYEELPTPIVGLVSNLKFRPT